MDKPEYANHPNSVLVNAIKFFEFSAQVPASLRLLRYTTTANVQTGTNRGFYLVDSLLFQFPVKNE